MQYGVKCECGWTAQGTKDELIQLTQQHGREVHNLEVTPEQARAQFRPIEA
jgi:predicted small metal-binding protein